MYMQKFTKMAEEHGHTVIPFSVNYPQNIDSEYKEYFVSPISKSSTGFYNTTKLTLHGIIKGAWNEFHNNEACKKLKKLIHDKQPDLLYVLIPGELSPDIFRVAKKARIPVIMRFSDFRLLCGKMVLLRSEAICEECIHGDYRCMVKHSCVHDSKILSVLRMMSLTYHRKQGSYKYVDAVIAPSKFTGEKFIESGYFPKDKVFINPTFIDCSNFNLHYEHNIYVLCLGRFSPEKGFIYVIESMRYLKDLPVTTVITGDWRSCDAKLKEVIEKFDLKDKVRFVGFLHGEELERMTKEAMCVACPSIWYENLPNVVIESFAYGKPVIASNFGSLADMVENGKTGLLFEPRNVEQIASCIRKLFENSDLCRELGENARKKAETEYSPTLHWQTFMNIYNSILKFSS